jgi:hypothetical protein
MDPASEAAFEEYPKTLHLLRNSANARRLLDSVREAEAGLTMQQELVDPPVPVRAKNRIGETRCRAAGRGRTCPPGVLG